MTKEQLVQILWDLKNHKYPNYDKTADKILHLIKNDSDNAYDKGLEDAKSHILNLINKTK